MVLLLLFIPAAIWYLAKDSFPKLSKLCGFISVLEILTGVSIYVSTQ